MPTRTELTQPSYIMSIILPQMKKLRAAFEGGTAFKEQVLIKRAKENKELFRDKIDNVAAMPICKSIVEEMIDIIFEQEPARKIVVINSANQSIATPLWVDDFLYNADYNLNTITDVIETAATLASVEGWSWIFVDLPTTKQVGNRPYLSVCSAENVIDYEFCEEETKSRLEYLKVIEYQDQEKQIIKVWEAGKVIVDKETNLPITIPTTASRYEIDLTDTYVGEITPFEVFEFSFDYPIPVIQVNPSPDLRNRFIGNSDISDASEVQRELLRLEAEAFDSIRFAKPLIRAVPGINLPAGGGGVARGDKDSIEVFAIPTADIAEIRASQSQLIETLDGYLGRSSTRKTTNSVQSGISIVEERRGLHRKAATRARVLQSTEEEVFTLVMWLMGLTWGGEVVYNTDYEAKDTQFRLALLKTAKELSSNSLIQEIIDKEVLTMIAPSEEIAIYLNRLVTNPTTDINNNTVNSLTDNTTSIGENP